MGGIADSVGGLLGIGGGPKLPQGQFGSFGGQNLSGQQQYLSNTNAQDALNKYGQGQMSLSDLLNTPGFDSGMLGQQEQQGFQNQIAEGPLTGTKLATEQVQDNPLLSGLYGQNGAMSAMANDLSHQVSQGYSLQPQDQTLYGQAAGNIARQYGQAGNDLANSLASRGLSASGAAGAQFSGLQGSQNEQLANAQTQIMQQRFQNTMAQANALNQMGLGAQQALNSQRNANLAGIQSQRQGAMGQAELQNQQNNSQNQYGAESAQFEQANKPANLIDIGTGAIGQAAGAFGKTGGQKLGASLFG